MKKTSIILILFLLLAFQGLLVSQEPAKPSPEPTPKAPANKGEIVLKSKVSKVTVYRDRAMVTRSASKTLSKGRHVLIFDKLPDDIINESITADGFGHMVLEDIKYREVYANPITDKQKKTLHNKKKKLEAKISELKDQKELAKKQKILLEKIIDKITHKPKEGKTDNGQLNPASWIKMVDFYRTKNQTLDKELRETQTKLDEKEEELDILEYKIDNLGKTDIKWEKQVMVMVKQTTPGKIRLTVTYTVEGPKWFPIYDLRVSTKKKKIDVFYNAMITQNSGEDWTNAKIELSTTNPASNSKHPELFSQFIRFRINPVQSFPVKPDPRLSNEYTLDGVNMFETTPGITSSSSKRKQGKNGAPLIRMIKETATLSPNTAAAVFVLKGKKNIASDNQNHKVTITRKSFPTQFRHSTVPKLRTTAFLKTQLENNSDFPLLPGKAHVFMDNAFITTTQMKHLAPGQKDWIFLGPDKNIAVEYKITNQQKGKKGFFKSKGILNHESIIEITNNKRTEEEIIIWDQLPVSENEEIKVELITPKINKKTTNAKIDDYKFISWLRKLKPGQKIRIPLKYTITYPKDKSIQIK